jgi:hypothetical protein
MYRLASREATVSGTCQPSLYDNISEPTAIAAYLAFRWEPLYVPCSSGPVQPQKGQGQAYIISSQPHFYCTFRSCTQVSSPSVQPHGFVPQLEK